MIALSCLPSSVFRPTVFICAIGEICGYVAGSLPQPDLAGVGLALLAFLVEVGSSAAGQFIKIHLVRVDLWAVDAGEFNLVAHGYAAAAAHSRAVYHDGIQAGHRGHRSEERRVGK